MRVIFTDNRMTYLNILSSSQAAQLSMKFLDSEKAVDVVQTVGPKLAEIEKYNTVNLKFVLSFGIRVIRRLCQQLLCLSFLFFGTVIALVDISH